MIYSVIVKFVLDAVNTLLGYLPTVTIGGNFATSIVTGSTYISSIYAVLPVIIVTLFAILTFDIVFESGYMLYKVIYWIIRRFPTQS